MSIATFPDGSPVPADGKYHQDPTNPLHSARIIEAWSPPSVLSVLSGGNTARVGLLKDNTVLKYPFDREDRWAHIALETEHVILSELGSHRRIVKFLGKSESGLRFQRAENGDVGCYLRSQPPESIPPKLRLKWSKQAAEALAFIHSKGVIHCDLHPNNFLLDEKLDLLLCDFSGSIFGDYDGAGMESVRSFLPRDPTSTPTVATDLFALGSAMYWIMSNSEPYGDLTDEEVTMRYSRGEFPNVDNIYGGSVILCCWKGEFLSAEDVLQALLEL
ncbi:MAG: hypothetical protein M1825_003913 [Sarcosagium campestre]|nr:MAG: hypothetical protein M1825_003913 [Sarcosagium campestre]